MALICTTVFPTDSGNSRDEIPDWRKWTWEMDKPAVVKALEKKRMLEKGEEDVADEYPIEFRHKKVRYRMRFSEAGSLVEIQARQAFGYVQGEAAEECFEEHKGRFLKQLGDDFGDNDDEEAGIRTLTWETEATQVDLRFDYRRKVIDEMGGNAFSVRRTYTPL